MIEKNVLIYVRRRANGAEPLLTSRPDTLQRRVHVGEVLDLFGIHWVFFDLVGFEERKRERERERKRVRCVAKQKDAHCGGWL